MNEYLQSYIEPELEARILALVLGEASAFEAGELERLMSERPELKRYQIGLEKTHGLLVEAHEVPENLEWKLSDECRGKILAKINEKKREEMVERRRRRISIIAQRRLIYTLAACFFLTLVIVVFNQPRSLKGEPPLMAADSQAALEEGDPAFGLRSPQSSISSAPVVLEDLPRNRLGMQRDMTEEDAKLKKPNDSLTGESLAQATMEIRGKEPSTKADFAEKKDTGLDAARSIHKNKKNELVAKVQSRSVGKIDSDEASAVPEKGMAEPEVELLKTKVRSALAENQSEVIEPKKKLGKKSAVERWGKRVLIPILILFCLFLAWCWSKRSL